MKRAEIQALIPTITKEQLDAVMEINGGDIEAAKAKFDGYTPKADYDKLKGDYDKAVKDFEALKQNQEQGGTELETLRKFKTDTETNAVNDRKHAALVKALETEKAHPSALKLLAGQFDLSKVELDDKGEIKAWTNLVKPVKEDNKDFFGIEVISGVKPGKAPQGQGGGGYDVDAMTMADWNKLQAENPQKYQTLLNEIGKKPDKKE